MLRYHSASSGHWLLAASAHDAADGRVLVVAAKDEPAEVERIWSLISSETSTQGILDELTRNGLSSTPEFALVEWSGELATASATLTCIVRGAALVTAGINGETVEVDGRSATTWAERRLESVASIDLKLGVDVAALATLPLERGVAWVDRVAVSGIGAATPPVSATAQPASAQPSTAQPILGVPLAKTPAAKVPAAQAPAVQPPAAEATATQSPVEAPVAVPALVAPPAAPIIAPRAETIEDSTIAEFTMASAPDPDDEPARIGEVPTIAEPEAFGYDSLFEETMVRSIEDAAVRPEEEDEHAAPATPAATAAATGDHDGMTMMGSDFAALREARKKARQGVPADAQPGATQGNAAQASTASPSYSLEISGGGSEPLVQSVIVGRAPSVSKVSGGQIPRLVTLTGNDDISRNHVQFSVEGDTVVVTDLHSRNGTTVILPGRPPQLLRAGEPTSVLVDTIVDLGGGLTLTVKES